MPAAEQDEDDEPDWSAYYHLENSLDGPIGIQSSGTHLSSDSVAETGGGADPVSEFDVWDKLDETSGEDDRSEMKQYEREQSARTQRSVFSAPKQLSGAPRATMKKQDSESLSSPDKPMRKGASRRFHLCTALKCSLVAKVYHLAKETSASAPVDDLQLLQPPA